MAVWHVLSHWAENICLRNFRPEATPFHQTQLEVEQHIHKHNNPSSPIIYTQKAHLLALKPVHLTGFAAFLCIKKQFLDIEWRMELALPRGIFGGQTYRMRGPQNCPRDNSARLMGGLLILSGVLQIRPFGGWFFINSKHPSFGGV